MPDPDKNKIQAPPNEESVKGGGQGKEKNTDDLIASLTPEDMNIIQDNKGKGKHSDEGDGKDWKTQFEESNRRLKGLQSEMDKRQNTFKKEIEALREELKSSTTKHTPEPAGSDVEKIQSQIDSVKSSLEKAQRDYNFAEVTELTDQLTDLKVALSEARSEERKKVSSRSEQDYRKKFQDDFLKVDSNILVELNGGKKPTEAELDKILEFRDASGLSTLSHAWLKMQNEQLAAEVKELRGFKSKVEAHIKAQESLAEGEQFEPEESEIKIDKTDSTPFKTKLQNLRGEGKRSLLKYLKP